VERARDRLVARPWVASLDATTVDGGARWLVAVHDAAAAEAELLRTILADEGVRVLSYGRRRFQLEDVFMSLIEGEGASAA
jgi:ABC-2 type transport system ATP-binding protein